MAKTSIRILMLWIAANAAVFASEIDGHVRANGDYRVATVQLLRAGDSMVMEEKLIGVDGRFQFRNLRNGSYVLKVRAQGFEQAEIGVQLVLPTSREAVQVDLRPVRNPGEGPAATVPITTFQIPKDAKKEYEQGVKDRKNGQCQKAVPHLEKAVAVFNKYGEAFNELGNCFAEMGQVRQAEDSFKKAIEYSETVYPSINLADLYAKEKRYPDALSVLRASAAEHRAEGDVDFAIARIHFDQGRLKEAEEAGLQAHGKKHRMADVHVLMAKLYLSQKKYAELVAQLRLYLEENPSGPVADQVRKTLEQFNEAGNPK
jgi:tetratricopeptide (TPR) repeat protein